MAFRILLLAALLVVVGCNAQDADTLGRIGSKLQVSTKKLLLDEPNGTLIRTLPLLQTPNSAGPARDATPKDGTRLNTEEP